MPHLKLCSEETTRILPVSLAQVKGCRHDGLEVDYGGMQKPCAQVLALVESRQKTTLEKAGGYCHRMVTKKVTDSLSPGARLFTAIAFCNLATSPSFRMDPPSAQVSGRLHIRGWHRDGGCVWRAGNDLHGGVGPIAARL